MEMLGLPSHEEANAALEQLSCSSSTSTDTSASGRDFILRVLNYATEFQSCHKDPTNCHGKDGGIIEKSQEAGKYLVNALNRYYSESKTQLELDEEEDGKKTKKMQAVAIYLHADDVMS